MVSNSAIAPAPTSPQANSFSTGDTIVARHIPATAPSCRAVSGWSHISVFMAGANTTGRDGSQARQTHVRQLSHSPEASFAKVWASSGAITNASAHLRNSTCNTRSPRRYNRPSAWPGHSSASVNRRCPPPWGISATSTK